MKIDEYTALILEQVQEGYHTLADLDEMKRSHESLGLALDDFYYVELCRARDIVQKFESEMDSYRRITLALARVTEAQLTTEQVVALNAYVDAYKAFYLSKWGFVGPHGATLREEMQAETTARLQWEASIQPLQESKA